MTDNVKKVITLLINNEIGTRLKNQLEKAGCELIIAESMDDYTYTNLTPGLEAKIKARKQKALADMMP